MCEIMDAILVLQHVDSVNDTVTTCDKDKKVIRRTSLKEQCTTTLKKDRRCHVCKQQPGINNLSLQNSSLNTMQLVFYSSLCILFDLHGSYIIRRVCVFVSACSCNSDIIIKCAC